MISRNKILFISTALLIVLIGVISSCKKDDILIIESNGNFSLSITHNSDSKIEFPSRFSAEIEIERIIPLSNDTNNSITTVEEIAFVEQTNGTHTTEEQLEVPIDTKFIIRIRTEISGTALFGQSDTLLLESGFESPLHIEIFLSTGNIILTGSNFGSIGSTSIVCNSTLNDHGGLSILSQGFIWNTSSNASLSSYVGRSVAGTGLGNFTDTVSSLSPNTTYYIRAYSSNSKETAYSSELSFTTKATSGPMSVETGLLFPASATSVSVEGIINDDGGEIIAQKGILWSETANPVITAGDNNLTNVGGGFNNFTSTIFGLSPSTTYYFKAYVITNTNTIYYADQIEYTLPAEGAATLNPIIASEVLPYSVVIQSFISDDGGNAITNRGIVISSSTAPDITVNEGQTTDGIGAGEFSSTFTGLTPGMTYYVRSYATNDVGTTYSNEINFITLVIGDIGPGGGHIFYLNGTDGGMEIAPLATEVYSQWGCENTEINAYEIGVGFGASNTSMIVGFHDGLIDYYGNPTQCDALNDGTVAAKYCQDLVYNGYDDWFLPTQDELSLVFNNLFVGAASIGDFAGEEYWTSSEEDIFMAVYKLFIEGEGEGTANDKFSSYKVRAIREF